MQWYTLYDIIQNNKKDTIEKVILALKAMKEAWVACECMCVYERENIYLYKNRPEKSVNTKRQAEI